MLELRVRDLMSENVLAVRVKDDLDVVRRTMEELGVRHVPVIDAEGTVVGLVSHRDLLQRTIGAREKPGAPGAAENPARTAAVGEIMNAPVVTVSPDGSLREAAQVMYENKFGCLPVVEGQRLVGILTECDFVRYFTRIH